MSKKINVNELPACGYTRQQAYANTGPQVKTRTVFKKMFFNVLKIIFIFVCIVAVLGACVTVGVLAYMAESTQNDSALLDLENISLAQTSFIMAWDEETEDWIEYQELIGPENRIWVGLDQIPEDLVNAVVAIEDREFYTHHGVSFSRTAYALANELFEISDSSFGASTIDQQLIKNLTGDDETDYTRKLREIYRAWMLNDGYSKDMIMEAYLNTIGLSENIAGVQAGAREYFDKDVSELTLAECATIAGITRAPTKYSPVQNPDQSLDRRNSVLWQMYETGYITLEEYEQTSELPLGLSLREKEEGDTGAFSYFSDMVFEDVVSDLQDINGWTRSEAVNYVYTAGLRIYCTVDLTLQNTMEEMFLNGYEEDGYFTNLTNSNGRAYKDQVAVTLEHYDDDGNLVEVEEILPQLSAASVRYDGSVAGVVGGVGQKEVSLSFNRATDSQRQVGSTMKPVAAYALGIDYGIITWGTPVTDAPVMYIGSDSADLSGTASNANWPKNFSNTYRNSGVPVVSAIAESLNTVAVRVGTEVGLENLYSFLEDTLEISSLVPRENENGDRNPYSDMGPSSLILGGLTTGISPLELAGAYTIFGGEESYGTFNSVHSYYKVLDAKGSLVLEPPVSSVQAISEDSGYIMNRLLWNVLHGDNLPLGAAATAKGMAPEGEMDSVAKTGTTSDDRDRWFVGLTPYYATAVWWGYDETPSNTTGFSNWNRVSLNVPNNVWKTLMEAAQANKKHKEFPAQPSTVQELEYCASTGLLASSGCPSTYTGYFSQEHTPELCNHGRSASAFNGGEEEGVSASRQTESSSYYAAPPVTPVEPTPEAQPEQVAPVEPDPAPEVAPEPEVPAEPEPPAEEPIQEEPPPEE